MKIRTQFILTVLLCGIITIFIAASVIISNQQVEQIRDQEAIAANIQQEANDLSYLANDYLLYQENQQLSRWESKFASFSAGLAELNPGTPEQQRLVDNIKADQQHLQAVFNDVKSNLGGPSQAQNTKLNLEFIQVSWSRMEVQSQGIVSEASQLSQMLDVQAEQVRHTNVILIFVLIGIFVVFFIINYFIVHQRLLKSMLTLRNGTKVVGSGNLDYSIPEKGKDEIGELSRAFNLMAANLKTVTASKADLEKEITERKEAEVKISHLASFPELNPNPILELDSAGNLKYVNPAAATRFPDLITQGSKHPFLVSLLDTIQKGGMHPVTRDISFGDSWYEQVLAYVPITQSYRLYVRDITGRKKAEEDLLRLNRELRAISDCNQAIVRSIDERTLSTDVCRIMCEVVGYRMAWVGAVEHDEAKSVQPVAWYGDDNGYLTRANITWAETERGWGPTGTAARTGKTDFCQDFVTEPKAGPWREEALKRGFRSSIAVPLFDNQGKIFAVFTLYAAESNGFTPPEIRLLEELASDLSFGINALRTNQERLKTQEQLRQRTQELETANKELEAFSYSVSHDLRAPLRILDGFSLAVLEDYGNKLDAQGKEYLERIRKGSQRMAQLIDDILKLSRFTRAEMYYGNVNLSNIANSIVNELKEGHPERQVEFIICPDLLVEGDSHLLQIALRNLFENSWKYTEKKPQARIEFGVAENSGEKAYFVKDNGAGFDMRYVDKLFQPFQRLHSDKDYPGTGIGLATIQRIIQRHGGRIWAEGEVEKGATFYFTLRQNESRPG